MQGEWEDPKMHHNWLSQLEGLRKRTAAGHGMSMHVQPPVHTMRRCTQHAVTVPVLKTSGGLLSPANKCAL